MPRPIERMNFITSTFEQLRSLSFRDVRNVQMMNMMFLPVIANPFCFFLRHSSQLQTSLR